MSSSKIILKYSTFIYVLNLLILTKNNFFVLAFKRRRIFMKKYCNSLKISKEWYWKIKESSKVNYYKLTSISLKLKYRTLNFYFKKE